MGVHGNTPIHGPFKQGECLVDGQGNEGLKSVKTENGLLMHPPVPPHTGPDGDREIHKLIGLHNGIIRVQHTQLFTNRGNGRVDPKVKRADAQNEPIVREPSVSLRR